MIFNKAELFGIQSQLFEYSNSIRLLKSNKYEYEKMYGFHQTCLSLIKNFKFHLTWTNFMNKVYKI